MLSKYVLQIGVASTLALGMSGCAVKYLYHSIPSKQTNQEYKVDVKIKKEFGTLSPTAKNTAIVYINGDITLKGGLSETEAGELQGMYNGKKLELVCGRKSLFDQTTCIVHLDNQRLGEFKFQLQRPYVEKIEE
jgi:hypothetical protein